MGTYLYNQLQMDSQSLHILIIMHALLKRNIEQNAFLPCFGTPMAAGIEHVFFVLVSMAAGSPSSFVSACSCLFVKK